MLLSSLCATPWDPSPDGSVYALSASETSIYVGGRFYFVAGTLYSNVVNVDFNGRPTDWMPAPSGNRNSVRALLTRPGSLFVGGDFTMVGTEARPGLAIFVP